MSVAGRRRTNRKAICDSQTIVIADATPGPEQKARGKYQEIARQQLYHPIEGQPLTGSWIGPFNGGDRCGKGEAHQSVANVDGQAPKTQDGRPML